MMKNQSVSFVKSWENKEINECIAIEGLKVIHLINERPTYAVSFGKKDTNSHLLVIKIKIMHNTIDNIR